jgi:cytosine/adenosine deaminase-related metal-dependent hydrolase
MTDASSGRADLLVRGGHVLTMDGSDRMFAPGAVAIRGDRIVAVGDDHEVSARFRAAEEIRVPYHVVMPGLVDPYSHAGHGLVKAIHRPAFGWPANVVYFQATTPEWWEAEARLSALERVRFGTTTGLTVLGGTPARADDAAYADAHLRGVLTVGIREMLSIGPPDPFIDHVPRPWIGVDWRTGTAVPRPFTHEQCMDVAADVVKRWHRTQNDRVRVCVHPPYLLGRFAEHPRVRYTYRPEDTPVLMSKAEEMRAFADRWDVLIHTHAFRGSLAWGFAAFGNRLYDIVGPDVVFAHANGLTDDEVALVAQSGAAVTCVATTDENVHYGLCPVIELLAAGVRVGIATDGSAPNMNLDLWKDIHRTMLVHRIARKDPTVLPVGKALRMVTIEAAQAIGWDREIGSLEPGKKADVITVDLRQPHLAPRVHIPQLLGYYAEGADVVNVIADGRVLMRDRTVLSVDLEETVAWAEREAEAAFRRVDVSEYLKLPTGYWRSHRSPL